MHKWKIAIGDYSDDGHGKCEYYIIQSNYSVKEAREAYFKARDESKINVAETFAAEYEEPFVEEKILELLPQDLVQIFKDNNWIVYDTYHWYIEGTDSMVHIVMQFIKYYNPTFEYYIEPDELPMLQFFGFDEKGRHIGQFGYGLFWE